MSGDVHVQFCEQRWGKFLALTLLIICCRHATDALKVKSALAKRLAKYKLTLNEDKTKMVEFSKSKSRHGIKQGTFDFLGFTFYLGKSMAGNTIPKLKTNGNRFRAKLRRVNEWARQNRNKWRLKQLWKTFCAKIRGHIVYYGVSFNAQMVSKFVYVAKRVIFKWLNRCSQRKSFDWSKFNLYMSKFPMPEVKIYHRLF